MTGAGLGRKQCEAGAGSCIGGCGLEVCACGTGQGKTFEVPAGTVRVQILQLRCGSGQKVLTGHDSINFSE